MGPIVQLLLLQFSHGPSTLVGREAVHLKLRAYTGQKLQGLVGVEYTSLSINFIGNL